MADSTTTINQAQKLLRRRLKEIEDESRRLERALGELGRKRMLAAPGAPAEPKRKPADPWLVPNASANARAAAAPIRQSR